MANFHPSGSEAKESKEDKSKRFVIRSPLEWALAFATYAAIYAQAEPTRASALMTYITIILRMARQSQRDMWARYDCAFRHAADRDPTLQWDRQESDIWLSSMSEEGGWI